MNNIKNKHGKRLTIQNKTKIGADICIINNSSVVQQGICSYIEKLDNINSITCTTKENYLSNLTKNNFDVIITDIEFENNINPSFIKSIKALHPEVQILVFTRLENGYMRNLTMNNGAEFFIYWGDQFQLLEITTKAMIRKCLSLNTL